MLCVCVCVHVYVWGVMMVLVRAVVMCSITGSADSLLLP